MKFDIAFLLNGKCRKIGGQARRCSAKIRPFSFLSVFIFTLFSSILLSSCTLLITETTGIKEPGGSSTGPPLTTIAETTRLRETSLSSAPEYDSEYLTLEDVSSYLILYEELPPNYLTKSEAYDIGWEPDEGNLWDVAEGAAIGGDRFGNREGLLPGAPGRDWYEADVNYTGGYRGPERLVYSDDGLIYYTSDHYESFELIEEVEGWGY